MNIVTECVMQLMLDAAGFKMLGNVFTRVGFCVPFHDVKPLDFDFTVPSSSTLYANVTKGLIRVATTSGCVSSSVTTVSAVKLPVQAVRVFKRCSIGKHASCVAATCIVASRRVLQQV
eukprot:SAG31_NODE_670_length_12943_cov_18.029508_10_plen_118_part_00